MPSSWPVFVSQTNSLPSDVTEIELKYGNKELLKDGDVANPEPVIVRTLLISVAEKPAPNDCKATAWYQGIVVAVIEKMSALKPTTQGNRIVDFIW